MPTDDTRAPVTASPAACVSASRLAPRQAGLGVGGAHGGIDADLLHRREVDGHASFGDGVPAHVMTAPLNGDRESISPAASEPHRGCDVPRLQQRVTTSGQRSMAALKTERATS